MPRLPFLPRSLPYRRDLFQISTISLSTRISNIATQDHIMPPKEKIASLAIVDYEALANKDVGEIQKLVQACQTVGMFYLNLRDSRMDAVFEDIPTIFKTGQAFFNLPHDSEEKTQSFREGMERGYEKMITSEASGSY